MFVATFIASIFSLPTKPGGNTIVYFTILPYTAVNIEHLLKKRKKKKHVPDFGDTYSDERVFPATVKLWTVDKGTHFFLFLLSQL